MNKTLLTLILTIFTSALAMGQTIVYVDSAATGANNGTSWSNAYKFLSSAISAAQGGSGAYIIRVAKGKYYPTGAQTGTNRTVSFDLSRGNTKIYGGYPKGGGTRNPAVNITVLSGDIGTAGTVTDNSYHVMKIIGGSASSDSIVIDGVTISGGYAEDEENWDRINTGVVSFDLFRSQAAGIFLHNENNVLKIRLRNVKITNNNAYGGSAINFWTGTGLFEKCDFSNNDNANLWYGTSAAKMDWTTCTFVDCTFNSNKNYGYSAHNGLDILEDCTFNNNGGHGLDINFCNLITLKRCYIYKNGNDGLHGYNSNVNVINSVIAKNTSNGVYSWADRPLDGTKIINLINTTIADNGTAAKSGDLNNIKIMNSIVWGNSSGLVIDTYGNNTDGTFEVSYTNVQGGHTGSNNYNRDPRFVDATNGDYRLTGHSLALNNGNNSLLPSGNNTDLDGMARIFSGTIDRGAYELQSAPLPITLLDFSARSEGANNLLQWQTASEDDGLEFEIQRSADGSSFSPMGKMGITGKAGSRYQYNDEAPLGGLNYYRLLLKNTDGSMSYSRIAIVNVQTTTANLQAWPNPATDNINIKINDKLISNGAIIIRDMNGKIIYREQITTNETSISTAQWGPGVYLLTLMNEGNNEAIRIVKN